MNVKVLEFQNLKAWEILFSYYKLGNWGTERLLYKLESVRTRK